MKKLPEEEICKKAIAIIARHHEEIADELRELVKSETIDKIAKIDDLRESFPKDLEELLAFEETGEYFIVRPRQFLGSDNFAKIAAIVRETGGEYISAGKESHFRFRK